MVDSYYITAALAYANGKPHIGHAYEFLLADTLARAHEVLGEDVLLLAGTDEHGEKVANTAQTNNKTPKDWVDEIIPHYYELISNLGISKISFVRTTDESHVTFCQHLWNTVFNKGYIYLSHYEGWYNTKEEAYIPESEAKLHNYQCPTTGTKYLKKSEECYFFRLGLFKDRLLELIANTNFVQPEQIRNQLINRLTSDDLLDLCVSRSSITWGIPVPNDPAHVMYVWFDALSGYISGLNYLDKDSNLSKYWPASVHLIGKDISWFHCVIWPAMLMAADLPLPKHVLTHGFILDSKGLKMSKSLNNIIDPASLFSLYEADCIRWYAIRNTNYGGDIKFSYESLELMNNSELCNSLGNLIHRATSLAQKCFNGIIPDCPRDFIIDIGDAIERAKHIIKNNAISQLAELILTMLRVTNKYLADMAPWKLKDDQYQKNKIIVSSLEVIYVMAHFLYPICPSSALTIFNKLSTPRKSLADLDSNINLTTGTTISVGEILFKQIKVKNI